MTNLTQAININGVGRAEFRDIDSKLIGDTFRIFVSSPPLVEPGKKYPVIYVLDGNLIFFSVREMVGAMSMLGEIPAAFVVGIGYPVEDNFPAIEVKRHRDYMPNSGGKIEQLMNCGSGGDLRSGCGATFLQFLREELKPAMEASYPIDPNDATITGTSYGGLFPSWVLLTSPNTFQRYVLCSPAIWFNEEEVWQWEEKYAANNDDLNASVFVTAGGLETIESSKALANSMVQVESPLKAQVQRLIKAHDEYGWPRMAEITPEFAEKLKSRNYQSLKIHCHNMPDETHMSAFSGGISRGLRYVFGHWKP